jgi:hypothetical protein
LVSLKITIVSEGERLNRKRAAGGCQDKVFLFGDEREREREREKVDPWVWIYKSFRDVNGYGVVCVKTLRISGNACPISVTVAFVMMILLDVFEGGGVPIAKMYAG